MNISEGKVYSDVALESVLGGVCELRGDRNDEETCGIAVSRDGTWQSRGYSSLNGVLTIISVDTGKVIGYEVMPKNVHSVLRGDLIKTQKSTTSSWPPAKASV